MNLHTWDHRTIENLQNICAGFVCYSEQTLNKFFDSIIVSMFGL